MLFRSTDVLISAVRNALIEVPLMNAHFGDDAITTFEEINIGLAVATEAGLMVPVLHKLNTSDAADISAKRKEAVEKARAGKLGMADVDGGTFTISNLGMLGIDRFDAILNPPQIGILAVGSTKQVVVANSEGGIVVISQANLTLTCDHRAVDGATGATFLKSIQRNLESQVN